MLWISRSIGQWKVWKANFGQGSIVCLFALLPARLSSSSSDCPAILEETREARTRGEIRVKAIRGWDKLLTWSFAAKIHPYPLASPLQSEDFRLKSPVLNAFAERFGYFSTLRPIVGVVTTDPEDLKIALCTLMQIEEEIPLGDQQRFTRDEFLAKVIAYRTLKEGDSLQIGKISYLVDRVIDLWRGMPAFGLKPLNAPAEPPILLFRGTDLTLTKERGWASILSDLDTSGPGFRTFKKARPQIEEWLQNQVSEGRPARLIGFSLGGAFVLYSLVEMPDLISQEFPSAVFNSPGISPAVYARWQKLEEDRRPPHFLYLNQGDLVSQIGTFFSPGFEVSQEQPMQVIEAHVTLMDLL